MPEWSSPPDIAALLKTWQRNVSRYESQITEARQKGTPCEQMIGAHGALRDCLRELELVLRRATLPPALAPDAQQAVSVPITRVKEAIVRLMARCGPLDSWKNNERPELSALIIELSNLLDGPFTTDEAIEVGKRIGVSLETAHPQAAPKEPQP
jgi:hypothetical protein